MRVTSIGLYSEEREIATFEFEDPSTEHPYLIRGTTGLDAEEIISKFYGFTTLGRRRMYEFSGQPREIVFRIALNPNRALSQTYSSLRDNLYAAVSASRTGQVDIRFNSGVPWFAYISGLVTKIEAPLSSKNAEVTITILCEDSIIRGLQDVQLDIDSSPTGLEPFIIVDNISTMPHGFEIELTIDSPLSDFSIIDGLAVGSDPDWEFKIIYPFLAGDVLNVNSQVNVRSVTLTRGVSIIPLAHVIVPGSVWPAVFKGTNNITFSDPSDITLEYVKYTPTFWGI